MYYGSDSRIIHQKYLFHQKSGFIRLKKCESSLETPGLSHPLTKAAELKLRFSKKARQI